MRAPCPGSRRRGAGGYEGPGRMRTTLCLSPRPAGPAGENLASRLRTLLSRTHLETLRRKEETWGMGGGLDVRATTLSLPEPPPHCGRGGGGPAGALSSSSHSAECQVHGSTEFPSRSSSEFQDQASGVHGQCESVAEQPSLFREQIFAWGLHARLHARLFHTSHPSGCLGIPESSPSPQPAWLIGSPQWGVGQSPGDE